MQDLQKLLELPRQVPLSPQTWAAAAVLGRLRTAVNDGQRSGVRDRGRDKNTLNDLQGALGELVGQELLDRGGVGAPTRGLLDLGGSVDVPDLVVRGDPPTCLDVKCHLDEPRKRLFLVNEKARQRSISRGVAAFLPVVAAAYHQHACVGAPIPVEDLEQWPLRTFGVHTDPGRQLHLSDLDRRCLGGHGLTWGADASFPRDGQWGPRVLGPDVAHAIEQAVGPRLVSRLRASGFTLDGLTSCQARQRLLGLLPEQVRAQLSGTLTRVWGEDHATQSASSHKAP